MKNNLPENEQELKQICTDLFFWWYNQPGTNTLCGYDEWRKKQLNENKETNIK